MKKGKQSINLANLLDIARPCWLCLVAEYDVVSGRFPFIVSGRQDSEVCPQTEAFTEVSFILEKLNSFYLVYSMCTTDKLLTIAVAELLDNTYLSVLCV